LKVEQYKLLVEFAEYYMIYDQQGKENNDRQYWLGLYDEANHSAEARKKLHEHDGPVTNAYNNAKAKYHEGGDRGGGDANADIARQNSFGAECSTEAAKIQHDDQVQANKEDISSHEARKTFEIKSREDQLARQDITKKNNRKKAK
jgi:hypothetical protein